MYWIQNNSVSKEFELALWVNSCIVVTWSSSCIIDYRILSENLVFERTCVVILLDYMYVRVVQKRSYFLYL
jgi:hypothetical protein